MNTGIFQQTRTGLAVRACGSGFRGPAPERYQVKWIPVHRFGHATAQDSGAGSIPQEAILI
jgi:hypothetical protein